MIVSELARAVEALLFASEHPLSVGEIERRLASFDQDRAEAVTWEQLKTELASRAR